ncbi:MAG: N-methyl-D-aspartate receptor NMDAR2C subunit [Burkholderiaceae bacterium]|nr:N-methyl-D-aspartate receptor NMDAR2C subunit [Burkholderiaceae bacterium]
MPLLHRSWQRAWQGAGCTEPNDALADELLGRYREPQRHYHTVQHLCECLVYLESVLTRIPDAVAVELALWFHDAVYDLAGSAAASNEQRSAASNEQRSAASNEQRSALWARQALLAGGAPADLAQRVHDLVMATRHDALPATSDQCWLVDIDLSILGAAPTRFDEYERQVRDEYAAVPESLFRRKRAEVLAGFLARPRLYSTQYFRDLLETSARANLNRSIAALAAAPGP